MNNGNDKHSKATMEFRGALVDKIMEVSREDASKIIDAWEDIIGGVLVMKLCSLIMENKSNTHKLEGAVMKLYGRFDAVSDAGIERIQALGVDVESLMKELGLSSEGDENDE